jgi:hypothetical protein
MPDGHINDPAHWRRRAEEARKMAEQIDDVLAQAAMLACTLKSRIVRQSLSAASDGTVLSECSGDLLPPSPPTEQSNRWQACGYNPHYGPVALPFTVLF